jgi:hypothetical protein
MAMIEYIWRHDEEYGEKRALLFCGFLVSRESPHKALMSEFEVIDYGEGDRKMLLQIGAIDDRWIIIDPEKKTASLIDYLKWEGEEYSLFEDKIVCSAKGCLFEKPKCVFEKPELDFSKVKDVKVWQKLLKDEVKQTFVLLAVISGNKLARIAVDPGSSANQRYDGAIALGYRMLRETIEKFQDICKSKD